MEKKSRLLIASNSIDGLYLFRAELILELSKQFDLFIACPEYKGRSNIENYAKIIIFPLDRRGTNLFRELKTFFSLLKIINRVNPETVLSFTIKMNSYLGLLNWIRRYKKISFVTGLGKAFHTTKGLKILAVALLKISLAKDKMMFFENQEDMVAYQSSSIGRKSKFVLFPGAGVNIDKYHPTTSISQRIIDFAFVGRIMAEKGIGEFIHAAAQLKRRYSNIHIVIVGSLEPGESHDYIHDMKDSGIEYLGFVDRMNDIYQRTKCIVLPSYHEGMANVLLEGAACGCSLIATDISGCREVTLLSNGYLVPIKDSEALFIQMEKYLQLDAEEKLAKSDLARNAVVSNFDRNRVVNGQLSCIKSLYDSEVCP